MTHVVREKRWGAEEIIEFGPYLVKRLTIEPGKTTSMHFHYAKRETIYVLKGTLVIHFDDSRRDALVLEEGDDCTIPEGRSNAHRMESERGCEYLECSTPQIDDSERLYLVPGDSGRD